MDATWYPIVKALHIIFMVTFFAGTFYIVRLFIYHTEAFSKWEPDRGILTKQYALMSRKLWLYITWPSAVLMLSFGIWMLWMDPGLMKMPWMHAKLGLVALLFVYHFVNQNLYTRLQRNEKAWSSFGLRLWNEGATLILFGVIFLAVLKEVSWYVGVAGLVIMAAVLIMAVLMYLRKRIRDAERRGPSA